VEINSPNFSPSFRWLWRVAFLPVLIVLVILEPIVTFVLAALALLGLLTTLFFYLVGPPNFPVDHARLVVRLCDCLGAIPRID
jgi:hypothetical protein